MTHFRHSWKHRDGRWGGGKLFPLNVIWILVSGESAPALADRFGVSAHHVGQIRTNSRRYFYVKDQIGYFKKDKNNGR